MPWILQQRLNPTPHSRSLTLVSMRPASAAEELYARRLTHLARRGGWVRRLVDPQRVYGRLLRRLNPGYILDVGCGLGRILAQVGGRGIGIDANPACVQATREAGFEAFLPSEFDVPSATFDSLVFAHVLEHLSAATGEMLIETYLPYLRVGGKVVVICPQSRGQRTDPTHVRMIGPAEIEQMASNLGLRIAKLRSFPFPAWMGRVFTYNETVAVLKLDGSKQ